MWARCFALWDARQTISSPTWDRWPALATPSAWKPLEEFLTANLNGVLIKGKLQNSFWAPEPPKTVMAWMKRAETRKGLELFLEKQTSLDAPLFNSWQLLDIAYGRSSNEKTKNI